MVAAAEPFDNIPEVILQEILLQLPSSASLIRSAFVSKHWGKIISSSDFLTRYRKLHPSSPLLGFFFSDRPFGLPAFRLNASIRSDRDLKAVQRRADLLLADLEEDSGWRIRDSRNGRLLLCRDRKSGCDSFSIYNPVSRRLVTIPVDRPRDQVAYFADCLLLEDGNNSLRVVSVQQHNGRIRVVEYDPDTLQWHIRQWQSPWALDQPNKLKPWGFEPMHAAGLIFWRYTAALALVLDCSSMQFSTCHIPVTIRTLYAIGEIEDGLGCFVRLDNGALQVWLLTRDIGGPYAISWVLSRNIPVRELLGRDAPVRQVVLVTNGLALLSWDDRHDQFLIDLKSQSLHAEFDFRGQAYPYQMAWPPVGLPSLQDICKEEAKPVQLLLAVASAPPFQDVDVAAPVDDVGLAAPVDDVDFVARIDVVAYTEGPLDVVLRPLDLCATEHVMAAEAHNLVGTVEDGALLMETMAVETEGSLSYQGFEFSNLSIIEEAQHLAAPIDDVDLAVAVDDVDLAAPIDDVDLAAPIDNVAYTEGPLDVVLRPLDLCGTEHAMAAEADNLAGTFNDGVPLMETRAAETSTPSADFVEGKTHSKEVQLECQLEILPLLQTAQKVNLDDLVNHAANRSNAGAYSEVLESQDPCTVEQFTASKAKNLVATADDMEQIMPATPVNMSLKEKTEALTELGGASRRGAIAARIRRRGYSGLPARHDELLSAHLRCLLAEGVLRLHADSPSTYIFAAPKPTEGEVVVGEKPTMSAPPSAASPSRGFKRGCGRPSPLLSVSAATSSYGNKEEAKRGRGRPRKNPPATAAGGAAATASKWVEGGRGRPPRKKLAALPQGYKRRRGRPSNDQYYFGTAAGEVLAA